MSDGKVKAGKPGKSSNNNENSSGRPVIIGATMEKSTVTNVELPKFTLKNSTRSYADSVAPAHWFHTKSVFIRETLVPCEPRTVLLANDASVVAKHTGDMLIPLQNADPRLHRVLFVSDMRYNLVSVSKLAGKCIYSKYRVDDFQLTLKTNGFGLGMGHQDQDTGLYVLATPTAIPLHTLTATSKDAELWHLRLAHINECGITTVHKHADSVPSSAAWVMCVEHAVLVRLTDYRSPGSLNVQTMWERQSTRTSLAHFRCLSSTGSGMCRRSWKTTHGACLLV